MKTKTKYNKKFVSRVKAKVDEDARIIIQEIAEARGISSGVYGTV